MKYQGRTIRGLIGSSVKYLPGDSQKTSFRELSSVDFKRTNAAMVAKKWENITSKYRWKNRVYLHQSYSGRVTGRRNGKWLCLLSD